MKLLKFEFTKHLTKFTVIFTSVMLLISLGVLVLQYAGEGTGDAALIREAQDALLSDYVNDRETYDADYADYEVRLQEFEDAVNTRRMSGTWYTVRLQSKKIDLDRYDDQRLYRDAQALIKRTEGYGNTVRTVVRQAYAKIEEIGIQPGNYVYDYQAALITKYSPLTELEIPVRNVRGWEEFFTQKTPVIFLAVTMLGVFTGIFVTEKRCRTLNVLRICRNGGCRMILTKLVCTGIFSVILTLLFTLTPLIVLALTTGLSDPGTVIQALPSFTLCPYRITIGGYLAIFVLIRIGVFLALSLFVTVFGQIAGSEIGVLTGSAVFLVLSYLLSMADLYSPLFPLRQFNFFDGAFVTLFFERYRAVNLFGHHIGLIPCAGMLLLGIIAILTALSFAVKLNSPALTSAPRFRKKKTRTQRNQTAAPVMSMSLFRYELAKHVLHPKGIALIALALAAKILISYNTFVPSPSEYERIYRDYLSDLGGEITEMQDDYIAGEEEYINASLAEYETAYDRYEAGEITYEEYRTLSEKKNYAELVQNPFGKVILRQSYLKGIQAREEGYRSIRYVYEEGILRLLFAGPDIPLLLLLLVLYSDLFSVEYQSGFIMILSLCRKGGKNTFRAKFILCAAVTTILYLMFSAPDLFFFVKYYGTESLSAGIMSIPDLSSLRWDLSAGQYLLLFKLACWIGYLILAAAAASLSLLAKNTLTAAVVFLGTVFIPIFLDIFGIGVLHSVSAGVLLCPSLLNSCLIQYLIYLAAVPALLLTGRRKGHWSS
ncbi:MAG: hypothetical protein IJF78_02480 [Clostridia bacterium]|nr:hypothetical protein [Clostridia bacterium]